MSAGFTMGGIDLSGQGKLDDFTLQDQQTEKGFDKIRKSKNHPFRRLIPFLLHMLPMKFAAKRISDFLNIPGSERTGDMVEKTEEQFKYQIQPPTFQKQE